MWKEKAAKISSLLFISWFVLTPVFWHLDLSKGTYGFYDMFLMAPYGVLHLTVFFALGAVSIVLNKISSYHVLMFSLYFPVIQLSNYPYLTIRDSYLHATPTKEMIETGHLMDLEDPISASWPASFFLKGVLAIVSGCDMIVANYILYLSLVFVLALVLCSFARMLERKGYKMAWVGALLFPCLFFNHLLDNFHHYSRTALAFTFIAIFFLVFMRFRDRSGLALQLLMIISVMATHPFQSFALIGFTFAYWALRGKNRPASFAIFSVVTFLCWVMFRASFVLLEAIDRVKAIFSPKYLEPLSETLQVRVLPWWGIVLRDFYKYSLLGLLSIALLAAIIIFIKKEKPTEAIKGLTALSISSVVMLFFLLALPFGTWQFGRFTAFAAFPAAFSSLTLLKDAIGKEKGKIFSPKIRFFTRRSMLVILLLGVVSLSATVMVLRFERNYYYGELFHPAELSSLSFFFAHDYNSTVSTLSWRTSVYAGYLNYDQSHDVLRLWHSEVARLRGNLSEFVFSQGQLINNSQFVITGMRDSLTLGRQGSGEVVLNLFTEEMATPRFDLVYSNEYYSVYKWAVSP